MVTRRDFLKTMTMASAGLAAGAGEILNAQYHTCAWLYRHSKKPPKHGLGGFLKGNRYVSQSKTVQRLPPDV